MPVIGSPPPRMMAPSSTFTVPLPVNGVSFQPFSVWPSNIEIHFGSCPAAVAASMAQTIKRDGIASVRILVPQRSDVCDQRAFRNLERLKRIRFARIESAKLIHNRQFQF